MEMYGITYEKYTINMVNTKHLGGHAGITHLDFGCISYLKHRFSIKTMLDIGCGPGGMNEIANQLDIEWTGIDGDKCVLSFNKNILIHDFTKNKHVYIGEYDIAWSCEFLEHIYEKYMDNYMSSFLKCKYVFVTHAPPNKEGHHHVNCKDANYWISNFNKYEFFHDRHITEQCKIHSTMKREFVRNNGLFFINKNKI
jgi:cyclopropane fatty-acyl-phospholipid synthase-like methyltransferase